MSQRAGFLHPQADPDHRRAVHYPELKELENKILGANERLLALEHQLFADILGKISAELLRIQRTATAVSQLETRDLVLPKRRCRTTMSSRPLMRAMCLI